PGMALKSKSAALSMSGHVCQERVAHGVDVPERRAAQEAEVDRGAAQALQEEDEIRDVERRDDALLDERSVVVELVGPDLAAGGDHPLTELFAHRFFTVHGLGSSLRIPISR